MAFHFLLDGIDPAGKWLAICGATLLMIYAVLRPVFKKKDPLERPPFQTSLAQQRSVERQMQNVLVEMSNMARQITAQLDTRSAKLELLIREADQKIAALNSSSSASNPTPSAPASADSEIPPDPRHADIYALADQGRTSSEIAKQLNRPSGEIELILALRQ